MFSSAVQERPRRACAVPDSTQKRLEEKVGCVRVCGVGVWQLHLGPAADKSHAYPGRAVCYSLY